MIGNRDPWICNDTFRWVKSSVLYQNVGGMDPLYLPTSSVLFVCFFCLMAYQLFVGYLMPKPFS